MRTGAVLGAASWGPSFCCWSISPDPTQATASSGCAGARVLASTAPAAPTSVPACEAGGAGRKSHTWWDREGHGA